jgi:hypothetical protein
VEAERNTSIAAGDETISLLIRRICSPPFSLSSRCGGGTPVVKQGTVPIKSDKFNHFVIAGFIADKAGGTVGHLSVRVSSSRVALQADPCLGLKYEAPFIWTNRFEWYLPVFFASSGWKDEVLSEFYERGLFD